ncbi:MAG: tRNA dihydrouridine synthase DusB [Ruminococcaceae bacterium]|nr:tRNA dihydrouridine synthase DusB [Oscillospiraceae bacterium]
MRELLKNSPVLLAPMAGVTDYPFRLICRRFGVKLTYSEMISTKALSYGDKKTKGLLYHEGERPFAAQIFGHEPEVMAAGAAYVRENGADIVDINMGCPAPKVANNGDGSALLKTPELCGEIVAAVKDAVDCPVTAKIRLGWEEINGVTVAKILEDAGVDAICVHGRTRAQQYGGRADWSEIAKIKQAVSVPVIANGDVTDKEGYESIIRETGCDGVMIGRGAMGNPWIFSELKGGQAPTPHQRIMQALEHTKMLIEYKGSHIGILESRKHVCWYLKGIPGSNGIKGKVNGANNYGEMEQVLLSFLETVIL